MSVTAARHGVFGRAPWQHRILLSIADEQAVASCCQLLPVAAIMWMCYYGCEAVGGPGRLPDSAVTTLWSASLVALLEGPPGLPAGHILITAAQQPPAYLYVHVSFIGLCLPAPVIEWHNASIC
jgi:hypothetical protein